MMNDIPIGDISFEDETQPRLTREQRILADYIERCARCLSKQQLDKLRADFVEGKDDRCAVCNVKFWTLYGTIPGQRHHCHCCGKALCNNCTITVQMENGHRSQDGHYVKDFDWVGKFCITHELSSGESKPSKVTSPLNGVSVLNCIIYTVKIAGVLISIVPSAIRPFYWAYRLTRLFV